MPTDILLSPNQLSADAITHLADHLSPDLPIAERDALLASFGVSYAPKPPLISPPEISLLSSVPPWPFGSNWETGLTFRPELCNLSTGAWAECSTGNNRSKDYVSESSETSYKPFTAYVIDRCSTFAYGHESERDELMARARRQLDAYTSYILATELWTGALSTQESLSNFFLADAATPSLDGGAAQSASAAMALLEGAGNRCTRGPVGMIHAPYEVVVLWIRDNLVVRDGNVLKTLFGTIVVADAGYPGTAPGGTAAAQDAVWAYFTDMVFANASPIEVIGGPRKEGTSRTDNTVTTIAERTVAALTQECCVYGVKVDAQWAG